MIYLRLSESLEKVPFLQCCDENGKELSGNELAAGVEYSKPNIHVFEIGSSCIQPDLILAEPSMIPIVSRKLAERLVSEGVKEVQYIPIIDKKFPGFTAINILSTIELIDENRSSGFMVGRAKVYTNIVLRKKSAANDFFRITGYSSFPCVAERIVLIFREYDIRGIGFGEI